MGDVGLPWRRDGYIPYHQTFTSRAEIKAGDHSCYATSAGFILCHSVAPS